jgi:hypothetical protein
MIAIEIFEEAVMAAIAFSATDRMQQPLLAQPELRERTRISAVTAIEPNAQFQPLDPNIVSASIPAFFIGRNEAGFWVAREAKGRIGGLFLLKSSAVEFARNDSAPLRCALIFPSEILELDIENRGSPLIARLARWTRHIKRRLASSRRTLAD